MLITLSPSKGQNFDDRAPTSTHSQARQLDDSLLLINEARGYSAEQIKSLMSVSDNIAQLNFDRFASFSAPFDANNAKQAIYAFKGDVYSTIEADTYNEIELGYAQSHLRILSGLYGALRPLDLIQPYRLEMKTKLPNPRGDHLYAFWGSKITQMLNADMAQQQEQTLVNLASNEYFKAIKPKELDGKVLHINFKETKEGKTRVVAIFAKRARGLMANWLIKNQIEDSKFIQDFNEDGYQYDASLSDDAQLTFTRLQPPAKK